MSLKLYYQWDCFFNQWNFKFTPLQALVDQLLTKNHYAEQLIAPLWQRFDCTEPGEWPETTSAKGWGNLGLILIEPARLHAPGLPRIPTSVAGGAGSACIHLGTFTEMAATAFSFGHSIVPDSSGTRSGVRQLHSVPKLSQLNNCKKWIMVVLRRGSTLLPSKDVLSFRAMWTLGVPLHGAIAYHRGTVRASLSGNQATSSELQSCVSWLGDIYIECTMEGLCCCVLFDTGFIVMVIWLGVLPNTPLKKPPGWETTDVQLAGLVTGTPSRLQAKRQMMISVNGVTVEQIWVSQGHYFVPGEQIWVIAISREWVLVCVCALPVLYRSYNKQAIINFKQEVLSEFFSLCSLASIYLSFYAHNGWWEEMTWSRIYLKIYFKSFFPEKLDIARRLQLTPMIASLFQPRKMFVLMSGYYHPLVLFVCLNLACKFSFKQQKKQISLCSHVDVAWVTYS